VNKGEKRGESPSLGCAPTHFAVIEEQTFKQKLNQICPNPYFKKL